MYVRGFTILFYDYGSNPRGGVRHHSNAALVRDGGFVARMFSQHGLHLELRGRIVTVLFFVCERASPNARAPQVCETGADLECWQAGTSSASCTGQCSMSAIGQCFDGDELGKSSQRSEELTYELQ